MNIKIVIIITIVIALGRLIIFVRFRSTEKQKPG